MSIFRTVRKLRDCDNCEATGYIRNADGDKLECPSCEGTGKVEIMARVSQAAATRSITAAKELPPGERAAARERLQDHEPEPTPLDAVPEGKELPKKGKDSKVGSGFISED